MTELQAALGLRQLARLDDYVAYRRQIAKRYDEQLASLPIKTPHQSLDGHSARHLYPIWIDPAQFDRKEVVERLRASGIGVNVHYIPVHTQPYHRQHLTAAAELPASERYYAGAMSIPIFGAMTSEQQDLVVAALTAVIRA